MPCPVCGRMMCDCTPAQRGQSQEEMMRIYNQDCEQARKAAEKSAKKTPKKKR